MDSGHYAKAQRASSVERAQPICTAVFVRFVGTGLKWKRGRAIADHHPAVEDTHRDSATRPCDWLAEH